MKKRTNYLTTLYQFLNKIFDKLHHLNRSKDVTKVLVKYIYLTIKERNGKIGFSSVREGDDSDDTFARTSGACARESSVTLLRILPIRVSGGFVGYIAQNIFVTQTAISRAIRFKIFLLITLFWSLQFASFLK